MPHAHDGASCECGHDHVNEKAPKVTEVMLFTSPTCPNCKMAKMLLDKAGIAYQNIDAATNRDLTNSFGIKQAPTLVAPDGEGYKIYENASNIKGFIESKKA
jgi:ribonucleoside-triphosphate reductase